MTAGPGEPRSNEGGLRDVLNVSDEEWDAVWAEHELTIRRIVEAERQAHIAARNVVIR